MNEPELLNLDDLGAMSNEETMGARPLLSVNSLELVISDQIPTSHVAAGTTAAHDPITTPPANGMSPLLKLPVAFAGGPAFGVNSRMPKGRFEEECAEQT